jgi:hypothetical protein
MKGVAGCRSVLVLPAANAGTLGTQYIYVEVTNDTASDIIFYPNDFGSQGHPAAGLVSQGIPIKAGTTREIPMAVYNYTATGNVTVVAYAQ